MRLESNKECGLSLIRLSLLICLMLKIFIMLGTLGACRRLGKDKRPMERGAATKLQSQATMQNPEPPNFHSSP